MQEVNTVRYKLTDHTVRYKLTDPSAKVTSALAHFNDGSECNLTCIEHGSPDEARKWYVHQKQFEFAGFHCAKLHCIDSSRVLIEHLDTDIDGWIKAVFESKDKSYWESHLDLWWPYIRERFIKIFRVVMQGLRLLHSKDLYHGNLRHGIAIIGIEEPRGVLYNMKQHLDEDWQQVSKWRNLNQRAKITQNQGDDYVALIDIINKIMNHAYLQVYDNIADGIPCNDEVEDLCLLQLRSWQKVDKIEWCLNPALFWEGPEEVHFLTAAHRLIYKQNRLDWMANSWFKDNWTYGVKSAVLKKIIGHQGSSTSRNIYADGVSRLMLWRNIQEHYYDNIPFPERKNWDSVKLHELFTKELDILAGAVGAVNHILESRDPKFRALFLEEMTC